MVREPAPARPPEAMLAAKNFQNSVCATTGKQHSRLVGRQGGQGVERPGWVGRHQECTAQKRWTLVFGGEGRRRQGARVPSRGGRGGGGRRAREEEKEARPKGEAGAPKR